MSLVAVGCHGSQSTPPAHGGAAPTASDPLALVGRWRVTAEGEPRGASLILGDEVRLFRRCGMLEGSWSADRGGDFIAEVFGGSSRCFNRKQRATGVPWIRKAVSYRIDGADRVLLNPEHQVVARLRPGAHPTPGPDIEPTLASPPALRRIWSPGWQTPPRCRRAPAPPRRATSSAGGEPSGELPVRHEHSSSSTPAGNGPDPMAATAPAAATWSASVVSCLPSAVEAH